MLMDILLFTITGFWQTFGKLNKKYSQWSNDYQCGMRIPRPGFNSQRVPITDADLGQVG